MSMKRATTLLVASVFCGVFPASITWSQSEDLRCKEKEPLVDGLRRCEDSTVNRKMEVDPSITNSIDPTASNSANSNSGNNADSSGDDSGDHDNGHGNDPDHDDSSNPGQGGGNHGAGK